MSEQTITYVGEPLARQFKDKIEANKKNIANEVERATSKEAALETAITAETERATEVEGILGDRIGEEMSRATAVEANLQSEINTIHTAQNCVDIVATYSKLLELDTSILHDNDKVEVLADETHEGNVYVYRLSKQEGKEPEWTAVGSMFTVGDSWKQWSKDNGSSAIDEETSAFLGVDNVSTEERSYQIGNGNTVTADSREPGDRKETDISVNIGSANTIEGEGFNLGKENRSTKFGITLGQRNEASAGSVTIGEKLFASDGSIAIGISTSDSSNLNVHARAGSTIIGTVGNYDYEANGGSVIIAGMPSTGVASDYATGGSMIFGTAFRATNGSMAIGAANTAEENTYIFGRGNNGYKGAFIIGRDNYSAGMDGIVFGRGNSVTNGINGGNIIDGYAMALGILNTGITGYSSAVGFNNHDVTNQSFVFGYDNVAHEHSVSIGFSNYTTKESFALGYRSHAEKAAITIGSSNTSYNGYGVLLGWSNSQPPAGPFTTYGHGILLGLGNTHFGQTENRLVEAAKTCTGNYIADTGVIIYCDDSLSWNNVSEDEFIGAMHRYFPDREIKKLSNSVCYWLTSGEYTTVDTDNHVIYYTSYSYSEMGGFSSEAEMLSFLGEMFPSYRTEYSEWPKYDYQYMSYLISYLETAEGDWNIPVSDAVYMNTMSFIAGADNTSYGNNNIALGVKNTVGSATQSDATDPHNDGFATAIGYNCRAVRNYDFAMGYKSTAEGGENIAISQSTAKGYNNLALYSSNIYGIRNTGIHDSVLQGTLDKHAVVHNYLRNSKVNIDGGRHTGPNDNESAFTYNTITFANVNIVPPSSDDPSAWYMNTWSHNTISGMSLNDTVHVQIGAVKTVSENTISGLGAGTNTTIGFNIASADYTGDIKIPYVDSFTRNDIHMSKVQIEHADFVTDNIWTKSAITMADVYSMDRNLVTYSAILQATPSYQFAEASRNFDVDDNIVIMHGGLLIDRNANPSKDIFVSRNIILNNAVLTADIGPSAFNSGISSGNNSDNMLVNSLGQRLTGCFSFGTYGGSRDTVLYNCKDVYNFGDNLVRCSVNATVHGHDNIILGALNSSINGAGNRVYFEPDDPTDSTVFYNAQCGMNHMVHIVGLDNTLHPTPENYRGMSNIQVSNTVTQQQLLDGIAGGYYSTGTKLRAAGTIRVNNGTISYFSSSSDDGYRYYNGGVCRESISWLTPAESMETSAFCQAVLNKELTDNAIYRVTSSGYYSELPLFTTIEKDQLFEVSADGPCYCVQYGNYADHQVSQYNTIFGNRNDLSGFRLMNNFVLGNQNTLSEDELPSIEADEATIHSGTLELGTLVRATTSVRINTNPILAILSGKYYTYVQNSVSESSYAPSGYIVQDCTEDEFIAGFASSSLQSNVAYHITESEGKRTFMPGYTTVSTGTGVIITDDPLHAREDTGSNKYGIIGTCVVGEYNEVSSRAFWCQIFGTHNNVSCNHQYPSHGDFIQGSWNTVRDGSNIICLGGGNIASGHSSVAIGNQLISDKWQTVIGKYNAPIAGPERLSPPELDKDKALFIVGNGYGDKDSGNPEYGESGTWKDEAYSHRSNAMVVYADGTVEAKRFVATDEPELALVAGAGLTKEDDFNAGTSTISLDSELAKLLTVMKSRPKQAGKTYMLQSSGEDGELAWVEVGMVDAE